MVARRAQTLHAARENLNTKVRPMPELFRAAKVAPMTPGWPLLEDAAVVVHDQAILDVGSFDHMRRKYAGPVRDLGTVTLAPAVFNSHVHLEMTHLLGKTAPGQGFVPWVKSLLALDAYAVDEPLVRAELLRLEQKGCAFVADISTRNAPLLAEILASSGLFFSSFHEVLGNAVPAEPDTMIVGSDAVAGCGRGVCAVAGHALYSTSPELLRASKAVSAAHGLPYSLHLAEHADEDAIVLTGRSPFLDLLRERGFLTEYNAPGKRPVPLAAELGLLDAATLCVHCVTVSDEDISTLATSRASVCLCPRSNEYIGVGQAPLEKFLAAGVNLCLGTDGLCSNFDLDPYAELSWLAQRYPGAMSLCQGLALVTENPARFFGPLVPGVEKLGSLAPGQAARFSVVPGSVLDAFIDAE
ncbi:MAG: amidohydrolase family protein [Humidesulfovibrio sp.]|nr:amidohydrolase family protein [Humidesulfovibrio sp.]